MMPQGQQPQQTQQPGLQQQNFPQQPGQSCADIEKKALLIELIIEIEFLSSNYNVIDFGLQYTVLLESAWAQEGKCLCF